MAAPLLHATSYPGYYIRSTPAAEIPWCRLARGSQILGAEIKCYLGRGGIAMTCYVLNVFVNL
jgi:hypothetical protein